MGELVIDGKTVTAMEINGKNVTELEIGGKLFTFKKPPVESFDYYWLYYKKNDGYDVDNFYNRFSSHYLTRYLKFDKSIQLVAVNDSPRESLYGHHDCLRCPIPSPTSTTTSFMLTCGSLFIGDYSNVQFTFNIANGMSSAQSLHFDIMLFDAELPDLYQSSGQTEFVENYLMNTPSVPFDIFEFEYQLEASRSIIRTVNISIPEDFTNREIIFVIAPNGTTQYINLHLTGVCLCNSDEVTEYPKPGEFAFLVVDGYNGFEKHGTLRFLSKDYTYLFHHIDQDGDDDKGFTIRTELRGEPNNYNLNTCDYIMASSTVFSKYVCYFTRFNRVLPSDGKHIMYDYDLSNATTDSNLAHSQTSSHGTSFLTRQYNAVESTGNCFSYAKLIYNNLDSMPVMFYFGARHVEEKN